MVSVDSMQVYRGMDIGTAKPTPPSRPSAPPSDRPGRPGEDFTRRPLRGRRPRRRWPTSPVAAIGPCSSAGPASTCVPLVDDLETRPAGTREVRAELEARRTPPPCTAASELDPVAAGPHRAGQPPPHRAGARGDDGLRAGPFPRSARVWAAYPALAMRLAGLRLPRASSTGASPSAPRPCWRPGFLDEVGRLAAGPAGLSPPPARRSATGSCWPTSRGVTLEEAAGPGRAPHPRASRAASGRVVARGIPASPGSGRGNPLAVLPARLGDWTEHDRRYRLAKHHGLGNDFLVVLDEANGRAWRPTVPWPGAVRPAPGHGRRRV